MAADQITQGIVRMLNQTLTERAGTECKVEGNSDLYGLGNRIGIYLQMVTVQLSSLITRISPTTVAEDHIGKATVIFILSTIIVLLKLIGEGKVNAVEVVPILGLLFAQVGVCRVSMGSKLTLILYIAELLFVLAFFTWFWWKGMDGLPRGCDQGYAFFFAKVSIWGWFRTFNKVIAIISVVFSSVTYIKNVVIFVVMVLSGDVNPDVLKELGVTGGFELTLNIGIILFVELSLKWNNITDVHSLSSPGQFMPFFIALAQLLSTIWKLLKVIGSDEEVEEIKERKLECTCNEKLITGPTDEEIGNQEDGSGMVMEVVSNKNNDNTQEGDKKKGGRI